MRDWLLREAGALLDWLLPPCCPLCGTALKVSQGFCPTCQAGIQPLSAARCPHCALPYPTEEGSAHLCEACLRLPPAFQTTIAAGLYDGTLRQAIHRFKYDGELSLERPLAQLLTDTVLPALAAWRPTLLIPVPLHRERLRARGFNQTLLLARHLGRHLGCPVSARTLIRSRPTPPQTGLSAAERSANLRGAFVLCHPLPQERIILLDDVMTTGATARECARLLKDGGAEVMVAVLARAARHGVTRDLS